MKEKIRSVVDRILLLKPLLVLLSEGRVFRLVFSWFLRVMAVVFVLGFLARWITLWADIVRMPGSLVLVMTLVMILAVAVAFAVVNIVLVKADAIMALPASGDYVVIPIVVLFIKLVGEIALVVYCFFGLAGFLVSLTEMGGMVLRMIPLFKGSGVEAGLLGLVTAVVAGFLSFFVSYFIAEQCGVLADIAKNTKRQ